MADKYRASDEFYNSLTDEQKESFKKEQENINKYNESRVKGELDAQLAEKQKEWEQQSLEKTKQQNANDEFLQSVPDANKAFIKDALSSGKDIEYIKTNYESLLKTPEPTKQFIDLDTLANTENLSQVFSGLHGGTTNEKTDNQFIRQIEENGSYGFTPEDWNRYKQLKASGKIK